MAGFTPTPSVTRDSAGWHACGVSETGYVRARNEDCFRLVPAAASAEVLKSSTRIWEPMSEIFT